MGQYIVFTFRQGRYHEELARYKSLFGAREYVRKVTTSFFRGLPMSGPYALRIVYCEDDRPKRIYLN